MGTERSPKSRSVTDITPGHMIVMTQHDDSMVTAWLHSQTAQGLAPRTTRRRLIAIRSFRTFLTPLPLDAATADLAEEWLLRYPNLATRHAYRSDIGIFYKWATRRNLIEVDPLTEVPNTRVPKGIPRPFPAEVVTRLLQVQLGVSYSVMVRLGLYAGLRVSEMANLAWEDIRLGPAPTMAIRDSKWGKSRVLPVHPALVSALPSPKQYGPVLLTPEGQRFNPDQVGRAVKAVLTMLGIDGVPHQLRHTFATELARASGGDMLLVALMLGHNDPATSMIYAQLAGGEAARVVDLMWAA